MPDPRFAIIGTGAVARVLGSLLAAAGVAPDLVVGRSIDSAAAAAAFIEARSRGQSIRASSDLALVAGAEIVMIATPDQVIAAVADELVRHEAIVPGAVIFHCAGALDASLLSRCAGAGAWTASVHPLTSFADPASLISQFRGVFCITEGEPAALERLEPLFAGIGARVTRLSGTVKAAYHAGAVMASGYLVTTLAAALAAEQLAGIGELRALEMLGPLIRTSIDNALHLGPRQAMTGPLPRGDDVVVRAHHAALERLDPELGKCYAALTRYAAHLLQRANPIEGGQ